MSQPIPDPAPAEGAVPSQTLRRSVLDLESTRTRPEASGVGRRLNGRLLDGYQDVADEASVDRLAQRYRHRLSAGNPSADLVFQVHTSGDPSHPEIIVGENNLLPFEFLRTGDRLGRAVVKVVRGDGAAGTGFLVAPGVLLTNHHVLPDPITAAAATVTANYEPNPPSDPAGRVSVVPLRPAELFVTDAELDFTFCAVRGLDYLGAIAPERNGLGVLLDESVNIIQHPRGGAKRVALQDNRVEQADRVVVRYACDTEPGSSGSPVFNNEWRLVALHHASVEVGEGTERRYLNEGIRLSAIGLWLDSTAAGEGGRPDQVARVRALFRGVDPRVGLFGALGRRPRTPRGAAQMIVDCHGPDPEMIDLAYWDLGPNTELGPARLEALAWVVADMGLDLWCLAGLAPASARALADYLAHQLGLEYQAIPLTAEPTSAEPAPTLLARRSRRIVVEPFATNLRGVDEPIRVLLRTADQPDRVVRLVFAPAARSGAAWPRGHAPAPHPPRRWLAGLADTSGTPPVSDALLVGPGAPASPEELERIGLAGLVPQSAAIGPDGACVLVAGETARIERVIVSPNLVPVLGGPPEIMAAADRELPAGVRRVAEREPIAVRLVFGPPRPLSAGDQETRPAQDLLAPKPPERVLADLLAPLLARCLADLTAGAIREAEARSGE